MNTIIKKRNKSSYKSSNSQKPKILSKGLLSNIHSNSEFNNFQSTVSNITKQLNNMSLGISAKTNNNSNITSFLNRHYLDTLKKKSKNIFNFLKDDKKNEIIDYEKENKIQSNFYTKIINNDTLCIENNDSFSIRRAGIGRIKQDNNYISFYNNECELKQENKNLKENIKFLLSQVKKYQKSGISIEESKYNNNIQDNEYINKLKNIINEKEKEINEIKNIYQKEINTNLRQLTNMEMQNRNLKNKYNDIKNKYNDLKNKYNEENDYKVKNRLNYFKDEIIKMNNSEIIENNRNSNFELNPKRQIFRTKLKSQIENSKNIENNNYSNKNREKRFTYHKANLTTDYTHNLIFNKNHLLKKMNLNLNEKFISLNNTYVDAKSENNYNLIKNDIIPKTTKAYNIAFLYKKTPIKTDIINNSNKSIIAKSASHNYITSSQKPDYQIIKKNYKKEFGKADIIYPRLIQRLSSTLYHKKNNNKKLFFHKQFNTHINNNSYNKINNYNTNDSKEEEIKSKNNLLVPISSISAASMRFSKIDKKMQKPIEIPLPQIDLSPKDLYHFPKKNNNIPDIKNINNLNNVVYLFNIDNMKFSTIHYLLEKNSKFNLSYSNSINHTYDILLSITNGFLIITGEKTNYLYYYNKNTNYIYNLCNLNYIHNKGTLLKINNDHIMCISGINSIDVEMYYIKDNIWLSLPKMNCPHSESSYMIYNNNIVFSFFGYNYECNQYINHIEFLIIKNYYSDQFWNKININSINNNMKYNLRNHSIFYRINKENNNSKDIFIVGGYNDNGRNNGLIQVFIENVQENNYEFKFDINFKKYEENKVKIKGNNPISLDKYNNMDNIFLFSNEFNQFFDEENNLFYSYNYDNNFNIHIIDNYTLKHTIYRNKIKKK